MSDVKLSKHFYLSEMYVSQTATRKGIDNSPNAFQVANLIRLCQTALEPIRELYDLPVVVSSGYRCPRVNRLVGGVDNSDHLKGTAGDINIPGVRPVDLFEAIRRSGIKYKQIILEYSQWVHVSVPDKINDEPLMEAWIYTRLPNGDTHKERVQ